MIPLERAARHLQHEQNTQITTPDIGNTGYQTASQISRCLIQQHYADTADKPINQEDWTDTKRGINAEHDSVD